MSIGNFFNTSAFDYEQEKQKFLDNMKFLKNQTVQENTFYKKWYELQSYRNLLTNADPIKYNIWTPTDFENESQTIEEIENLYPEILLVDKDNKTLMNEWLTLRVFCHSMTFDQNPGRFLRFLIRDKHTKKYLGVVSVVSDVISIKVRDEFIGWTSDNKLKDKKLRHSAIGSCIMSCQPFGYNFLGNKLIASLVPSKKIRDIWKELYDDTLVGVTTTSLFGTQSIYNGIPYWKKCGGSAGEILLKPDDNVYKTWHEWLKENKKAEYDKMMTQKEGVSGPVTGAKQRVINFIFKQLGIKQSDYKHGFERGVYYSCVYENTKEFLQNKIQEDELVMKDKFKNDIDSVLEWWKPKAINRYKKLKQENKLNVDRLFYSDMVGMTYDEAKNKYLENVGKGR